MASSLFSATFSFGTSLGLTWSRLCRGEGKHRFINGIYNISIAPKYCTVFQYFLAIDYLSVKGYLRHAGPDCYVQQHNQNVADDLPEFPSKKEQCYYQRLLRQFG